MPGKNTVPARNYCFGIRKLYALAICLQKHKSVPWTPAQNKIAIHRNPPLRSQRMSVIGGVVDPLPPPQGCGWGSLFTPNPQPWALDSFWGVSLGAPRSFTCSHSCAQNPPSHDFLRLIFPMSSCTSFSPNMVKHGPKIDPKSKKNRCPQPFAKIRRPLR